MCADTQVTRTYGVVTSRNCLQNFAIIYLLYHTSLCLWIPRYLPVCQSKKQSGGRFLDYDANYVHRQCELPRVGCDQKERDIGRGYREEQEERERERERERVMDMIDTQKMARQSRHFRREGERVDGAKQQRQPREPTMQMLHFDVLQCDCRYTGCVSKNLTLYKNA